MGTLMDQAISLPGGLSHPFCHVVWECDNHTHIYAAGGGEMIEEMAQGLAESVYQCGRTRLHVDHKGVQHCTSTHLPSEAEEAYKSAVYQLLTRDYHEEYVDLCRKIEWYELWNKGNPHPQPVPALVLQPKPGEKETWQCFVTHPQTGRPHAYDIPASLLDLPRPDPKQYVEGSLGYYKRGNTSRSLNPLRRLKVG